MRIAHIGLVTAGLALAMAEPFQRMRLAEVAPVATTRQEQRRKDPVAAVDAAVGRVMERRRRRRRDLSVTDLRAVLAAKFRRERRGRLNLRAVDAGGMLAFETRAA